MIELDYDEICDVIYGRMMRWVNDDPDRIQSTAMDIGQEHSLYRGLGASGSQVEMSWYEVKRTVRERLEQLPKEEEDPPSSSRTHQRPERMAE